MANNNSLRRRAGKPRETTATTDNSRNPRSKQSAGKTSTNSTSPHFAKPTGATRQASKETAQNTRAAKRKQSESLTNATSKRSRKTRESYIPKEEPPTKPATLVISDSEDSEDEQWEEVAITKAFTYKCTNLDVAPLDDSKDKHQANVEDAAVNDTSDVAHTPDKTIEITLDNMPVMMRERPSGVTKQERQIKITVHHLHLLCLMAHWLRRHRRVYHPQIQGLLMSLVPMDMLNYQEFEHVEPSLTGNATSDIFKSWLEELLLWWNEYYWVEFTKMADKNEQSRHGGNSIENEIECITKCLETRRCSKNTAVLLFVSLIHSLGHRVRLVVSLEPAPHTASHAKPNKKSESNTRNGATSKDDGLWIAVDIFNSLIDQPDKMEENRPLPYVTAFEINDRIKDVSKRYASQWAAKTLRRRPPASSTSQFGHDWWTNTLSVYRERHPTDVDAREDAELLKRERSERMPTTVGEFNNHPLYVLERHLKKFEVLYPREPIIGHIRGEPVYPRSCVQQLHTTETWLREGRQLKIARAVTLHSRREQAMAEIEGVERTSALYGEWQTEPYVAPPIVDGKVPKNAFGNIDMFQPSMLPQGGCHIKLSGIAKIARKLKIDYADAVTGFDFHQRRCIPILTGIVIPMEYEEELLDAWHVYEADQLRKNRIKREKAALQRWRKLVRAIQIRDRLARDYGEDIPM
ncbi:Rad4 beta-hairpin domain 3-domain-containing protein [Syncephalis plumigaleata]|nr:Rad4 beta-hairpin domain 3-domain-containing protein [Syncephalis plumigaleata]